jgi:hypothetical protein
LANPDAKLAHGYEKAWHNRNVPRAYAKINRGMKLRASIYFLESCTKCENYGLNITHPNQ